MHMIDAFKNAVFRNYAQFSGRTHRAEYWWFVLATFLIAFPISFCGGFFMGLLHNGVGKTLGLMCYALLAIIAIALIIPNLAIQVRRLHDIGLSGWWILLALIPYVGTVVILILMLLPSKPTGERYGPYIDSK